MNFKQIKETCLYFEDLSQARDFYHGLLQLPIISYAEGRYIFFRAGSSVLLCFNPKDSKLKKSPPPHFSQGAYHFAFEVASNEYEQHKQSVIAKGIAVIDTMIWKTGQESFYFKDPIGNVVEIVPEGIWE